jgi:hypothetical protein
MKSRKTDMAKPARTSARCKPKGWRIEERFHTSKLQRTSTVTQIVADIASKKMRWERAVRARDPAAEYRTYIATRAWQAHQAIRVVCSFDLLVHASFKVGIGREAGSASGARGGGSVKIWCCVLTLLCLYLWPLRLPMFLCSLSAFINLTLLPEANGLLSHTEFAIAGESLMACVWKLNGPRCPPGGGGGPIVPSPPNEDVLKPVDDGIDEVMEPKRPEKVSTIGDKELGSKRSVECTVRLVPSILRPSSGSSGIGVGGVGVRGGAGMGRLEAIAAV